jgi:hypothetical protein
MASWTGFGLIDSTLNGVFEYCCWSGPGGLYSELVLSMMDDVIGLVVIELLPRFILRVWG